jgi:isochorismate hydrolase
MMRTTQVHTPSLCTARFAASTCYSNAASAYAQQFQCVAVIHSIATVAERERDMKIQNISRRAGRSE